MQLSKTWTTAAWSSLLAVALLTAPARTATGADAPPAVPSRTFAFTYEVRVPRPADGTRRLETWVPTPVEDDLQRVADLSVEATVGGKAVPFERTIDPTYGNRMVFVGLDAPQGDLLVRWTATVTRLGDEGQGTGPVVDRFTQPDVLVPISGRASDLAKQVGAEQGESVRARARKVYDHVLTTMVYDKVAPGWGRGDFERACEVGKGNCTDFHAKFTGIARAAGIPVRFTMGVPLGRGPRGAAAGYHCWAHFLDGKTWVPVDVSEAQKVLDKDPERARWFFGHLDPDRVALSVGRDLTLAPKQKGPPLLFFVYPYAEADGKAVEVPKGNRTLTWQDR